MPRFCYGIERLYSRQLVYRFKSKGDRKDWLLNDEERRAATARECKALQGLGRWVKYVDGPLLVDCEIWNEG